MYMFFRLDIYKKKADSFYPKIRKQSQWQSQLQ